METWLARAMQISMLEKDQIEKIHELENRRGHYIANYNIQELFNLSTIRDRRGVPDNAESDASHSARIRMEILKRELKKTAEFYENSLDWLHAFDWNIHNLGTDIIWEYSGSKKGSILNKLSCLFI